MHLTKKIALLLFVLVTAAAAALLWPVKTAHSEPKQEDAAIEATADDYARLCGLTDVVCGNEKTATVTAYTSRPEETDDTPCIGAFNDDICALKAEGTDVCASRDYPKGTRLEVEGLGTCIVLDRMNRRYTGTGRIDWYFGNDLAGALAWGVHEGVHILVD